MARRKTAAQQAIKDMLAQEMDISMFINQVTSIHLLNEEIGITEKYAKPIVKMKVEVRVSIGNYTPPEALKPLPRKRYTFINGCMCLFDDYDND